MTIVNVRVASELDEATAGIGGDPLSEHVELSKYAIYATDGHSHKHAVHDQPVEGRVRCTTCIYSVNLRSESLRSLAVTEPQIGKKKEHEISTLKRIGKDALRMGESAGTKVIHVYDKAITDYEQWHKWKKGSGIYVLTMEKESSAAFAVAERSYDRNDPRNAGVISDEYVETPEGYRLRRVVYKDPVAGTGYRYITNEFMVPPGLIAYLYKRRWDIEKIFDEVKNATMEQKSWASSKTAKMQHACFIALAHNLMVLVERILEKEEGMRDEKVLRKKEKRLKEESRLTEETDREMCSMIKTIYRASRRTVQFLVWLQTALEHATTWAEGVLRLRPLMESYLK